MLFFLSLRVLWLLGADSSHAMLPQKQPCPLFSNGTITINSYQLYPENVDFDQHSCLLYIGSLYNASVVVYDPYKASVVSTIEFPNITRTPPFHIGGVAWDPYSGDRDEITILVDAAPAHETAGRNITGENYLIRYSSATNRTLWQANLTAISCGRYGGPQDVEHDAEGNIYVLGTYPGTLQRVSSSGIVSEWFVPPNKALDHNVYGFTGLAAVEDTTTLLVADARNGSVEGGVLWRFDMSASRGKGVEVGITYPDSHNSSMSAEVIRPGDAIYLPARYGGEVLLIAEHAGGVSVLRARGESKVEAEAESKPTLKSHSGKSKESKERRKRDERDEKRDRKDWRAAEFLGRIPNPPEIIASGGVVTAAVEVGGSVFLIEEWFTDPLVPGTSAGNRSLFPLIDITAQLDALVNASQKEKGIGGRLS
ncbi:hypothetical protein F5Y03DRAFT_370030 [Xylaria venustula]|nr:hypothetical protein F5Y03DRAFT_370030 [Xylaria venustula]